MLGVGSGGFVEVAVVYLDRSSEHTRSRLGLGTIRRPPRLTGFRLIEIVELAEVFVAVVVEDGIAPD